MAEQSPALLTLNPYEARTAAAAFERLFPADEHGPGATAIGVITYVDRALAGAYRDLVEMYRIGLAALDYVARQSYGAPFAGCAPEQQDTMIAGLEQGDLAGRSVVPAEALRVAPCRAPVRQRRGWPRVPEVAWPAKRAATRVHPAMMPAAGGTPQSGSVVRPVQGGRGDRGT